MLKIETTPKEILKEMEFSNVPFTRTWIQILLRQWVDDKIIEQRGRGKYVITTKGKHLLRTT